jgi:tetratricopeptide (TPR) repeat protein
MNQFFVGLIAALLFANVLRADTNSPAPDTGTVNTNDVAQQELEKVMQDDDVAMDEINRWISENNAFSAHGAGESKEQLNERIMARLKTVRSNYENYLVRYPTNAAAYLAYGSFLDEIGDDEGAHTQYEKGRQLDPSNPAAWNDLANYYGENGPVTNAFAYYTKASELDPTEPVYYQNFATTVYLYRKDAEQFYDINEGQVFDKSLALYQKAIKLDPDNFTLMTDYAESYYGIKPLRTNDALVAWTNALKIAHTDLEREGVYIHLARIKIAAGYYAEAQAHLDAVTNDVDAALKNRLERNLRMRETAATNAPVALEMSTNPPASSGQKMP